MVEGGTPRYHGCACVVGHRPWIEPRPPVWGEHSIIRLVYLLNWAALWPLRLWEIQNHGVMWWDVVCVKAGGLFHGLIIIIFTLAIIGFGNTKKCFLFSDLMELCLLLGSDPVPWGASFDCKQSMSAAYFVNAMNLNLADRPHTSSCLNQDFAFFYAKFVSVVRISLFLNTIPVTSKLHRLRRIARSWMS